MLKTTLTAGTAALIATLMAGTAHAATATMWVRSDGAGILPHLVDAFNAKGDDKIKLDIVPAAQLVQKYATSIAAGNAPDALSLDLIYTPAFAAAGQLEDVTDWAKGLPYFAALSPAHVKTGTYKDRIYGLPFSAEASVLVWNKALFKQAGLDPEKAPTTWAEIEADATKVAALGNGIKGWYFSGACGGCNIFTWTPLIWASGGDILSEDGSKSMIDTPKVLEAVNFYRDMIAKGLVPDSARADQGSDFVSFQNGKIGLSPSGAFAIGLLTTKHKDLDFGVTFLPGKDGGWSSFAGGDNFVITKGSKNADVAKKFLEYSYTLEGQTLLAKYGSLPVRTDISKEALKDNDPRYAVAAEAMAKGHTPYSVVFNDIINSPNSPWTTMIGAAMYGDDPAAALKTAQETTQSIIDNAAAN